MNTSMFTPSSLAKCLVAGVALLIVTQAQAYKRVYVHTDAEEDYLEQRSPDKPESYYFFKGIYFGGYIRDDSLKQVEVLNIEAPPEFLSR